MEEREERKKKRDGRERLVERESFSRLSPLELEEGGRLQERERKDRIGKEEKRKGWVGWFYEYKWAEWGH
jgi:hypothetical protein